MSAFCRYFRYILRILLCIIVHYLHHRKHLTLVVNSWYFKSFMGTLKISEITEFTGDIFHDDHNNEKDENICLRRRNSMKSIFYVRKCETNGCESHGSICPRILCSTPSSDSQFPFPFPHNLILFDKHF